MSKRALKKYLNELPKSALEEQVLDLYLRFPAVKKYYDFVFNPKEEKLLQEAKLKIANEYFPVKRKRAKARRSVAHKYIKHFTTLGMDPVLLADLMLFNIETAQRYSEHHRVSEAFYKSMLKSFEQTVNHIVFHGLTTEFKERIISIFKFTQNNHWMFPEGFARSLDVFD